MSDKSVALKHFRNKIKTTELSFYLLIHCVPLKIKKLPYAIREMSSDQTQKMKRRMNY